MEELISVIVPVYNAEKSIARCIHSILRQKDVRFEIIIIDDGSKDHSLEKCKELAYGQKKIKVYHTENNGVSHARNLGMEKAEGKWLVFVDADDELVEGALFSSMKAQEKYSADTVCWNIISITPKGSYPCEKFRLGSDLVEQQEIRDLQEALYYVPGRKHYFYGTLIRGIWGKMYSMEIIYKNKIKFTQDMAIGEDAAFLFEYFNYCKRIAFLDEPLYKYYELGGSVTKKYKKNFFAIQKKEAAVIKANYKKYGMDPENALVNFWNVSFMTYIENEYKICRNDLKVIKKADRYLRNDTVKRYLSKNKSNSRLSRLKSMLMRYHLTLPVACIYVQICKKNVTDI